MRVLRAVAGPRMTGHRRDEDIREEMEITDISATIKICLRLTQGHKYRKSETCLLIGRKSPPLNVTFNFKNEEGRIS
jgi:hypothetical protein